MSDDSRLAVLIDADNISAKVAKDVFEELAGYGNLTVKRAYGDWTTTQLNGWKDQLHSYAIAPMQQFAYTVGKNSTDSALIIDAMDLLYAGHLDGFVIVSSDSDFTRLATRLRESGMKVYGLGAKKTPRAFRDACDKFTFLEVLRADNIEAAAAESSSSESSRTGSLSTGSSAGEKPAPGESAAPEPVRDTKGGNLQSMLTKALNKTATDDDWSALGSLGSHLNRTDPSFDSRTYGFAKLSDLVKDQPFLETRTVETESGRNQLWVRLKRRGAAKQTAARKPAKKVAEASPEHLEEASVAEPAEPAVEPAKKASVRRRTTRRVGQAAETPAAVADVQEAAQEVAEAAAQPDAQPETQPETQPAVGPAVEPGEEAYAEPVKKAPARRRTTRKVGQAAVAQDAAAQPTAEPVAQADTEADAEAAAEPDVEPAKKSAARRRTTRKVGQASGGGV